MSAPTYTPGQQVRIKHGGQSVADAVVIQWTDDGSDHNADEVLHLRLTTSGDVGWPVGLLTLRRPHWARGYRNWERWRKARTIASRILVEPS